jgi:thymidylate synthase
MTNYDYGDEPVNQLQNIIQAINTRSNVWKAACTIIIQKPGNETTGPRGGPCLNYIAVQMKAGNPCKIGFLCVYRNHDLLERTYGNYWGLCNLLQFLAAETNASTGPLTCISSHAEITKYKTSFKRFLDSI